MKILKAEELKRYLQDLVNNKSYENCSAEELLKNLINWLNKHLEDEPRVE